MYNHITLLCIHNTTLAIPSPHKIEPTSFVKISYIERTIYCTFHCISVRELGSPIMSVSTTCAVGEPIPAPYLTPLLHFLLPHFRDAGAMYCRFELVHDIARVTNNFDWLIDWFQRLIDSSPTRQLADSNANYRRIVDCVNRGESLTTPWCEFWYSLGSAYRHTICCGSVTGPLKIMEILLFNFIEFYKKTFVNLFGCCRPKLVCFCVHLAIWGLGKSWGLT